MQKVRIALLGFGNVGQGVWQLIQQNGAEIQKNYGCELDICKILVRDPTKPRAVDIPQQLLTTNIQEILNDDSIKIVVELMGGKEPAKTYMLAAMAHKKHVVTANKLVLATTGEELLRTAAREKVFLYYEGSVGGGIPIIRGLQDGLSANRIEKVAGIINGTTNYILSKMTTEGMGFSQALQEAQLKGYAEADPTSDIEGEDATYKLAIIASIAFKTQVDPQHIYKEGIGKIGLEDITYARKLGFHIKLLAIAVNDNNQIELRVHPALIPKEHPIANVNEAFNAIYIKGNAVGDLMLYGPGAGGLPTGSAVVSDIISVLKDSPFRKYCPEINQYSPQICNLSNTPTKFYIRIGVAHRPCVLNLIHKTFRSQSTALVNFCQDDHSVAFITAKTLPCNVTRAINTLKQTNIGPLSHNVIRIEDL